MSGHIQSAHFSLLHRCSVDRNCGFVGANPSSTAEHRDNPALHRLIVTQLAIDDSHRFMTDGIYPLENALPFYGMLENVAEAEGVEDEFQEKRMQWIAE